MKFSILLPHYKTGKMTAYAVAQLIKFKGKHELDIIVINNSYGHSSINHIIGTMLWEHCKVLNYPQNLMQSHGIAFDHALMNNYVSSDYFITVESDSFPTEDNWLDYYEDLINHSFDAGGSVLQLSGGKYLHPSGAFYKKSVWKECYRYCREMEEMYFYLPNMIVQEGHACHAMIKKGRFLNVMEEKSLSIHDSYRQLTSGQTLDKAKEYSPVINPFHNGMGNTQEKLSTYRFRTIGNYNQDTVLDGRDDCIIRLGYEPGQFFSYWMLNRGYQMADIPTEVKWLQNRENQQQEYTKNTVGFTHLWATTSYNECEVPELQDIVVFKRNQMESLYQSLPEKYKL